MTENCHLRHNIFAFNDITVGDKANAPVEYYNLQGMRIAAPVEGQLVIKRQGSEVEKLIIR